MNLEEFRRQFPVTRTRAYLFAGAIAPAAAPVRAAADAWLDAWTHDPLLEYWAVGEELESLRRAFALLVNADPDEVAIVDSTSRAAGLAIRLLRDRPGTIVVDDSTYPSSIYPWVAAGRRPTYVPTDAAEDPTTALVDALDGQPAAVAVSHVAPLTGRRHDVARLAAAARERGAVLLVDAAQTTGVVPVDVRRDGIDVLVTTAMKWLLGPPGVAFLYVRRELLEQGPSPEVGYLGARIEAEGWPRDELPPLAPGARRLEPGLPSMPGLVAARAGIDLVRAVGEERIAERVETLVTRGINGLRERGVHVRTPGRPAARAGVVAAEHPQAVELAAFLRRRAVDIGGYPWGLLRVDPHAYCLEDDLDRFLEGLDAFERGAR